ncbi:Hydrogenase-4 component B [hydrothermal vent metagenome]|uniref:Hydrogenase-4 component B n=1 Tax=hydrothermal vent metagenome TaxID=652676 RepID=A0A3B1BNJ7_9ZZZZ
MIDNLPLSLLLACVAVLMALGSALLALAIGKIPAGKILMFTLLGLSGIAAVAAGLTALSAPAAALAELPLGLPWLPWHLRLDALSGFFMFLIGLVVMAVAVYGPGYVRDFEHGQDSLLVLGVFTGLFVAGMLLVVLADDAFLFMLSWELMSLSSYFLVAFQHEQAANRRAAFIYLLMAQIGALSILLSYGVLAGFGNGFAFDSMRATHLSSLWASVAFALGFIGFGMKAGLVPMHAWLPEAHPAAPSHISALMSGVMLKVAVYGFIRFTFDLLGQLQWQWGVVVLVVGSISALTGVLAALMQRDLKRLLAYSSVENIGIIFISLGLGLIFLATGHPLAGVLGLIAALYHSLNHALFKSLLFLGAGAILHAAHERDLERMGGLLRRMPWTGLFFLAACISISALPPFNGFVSEWLTLQTALQAWVLEGGVLRSLIPIAAAVLALTGALSAACFVRAYGIAFLGQARSRRVRRARPVSWGMRMAQGFLALLCLLSGIFPTTVLQWLNAIPQQLLGRGLSEATAHGWLWLTPIAARTASYSAPIVLLALLLVWWLSASLLRRGKVREVRRCDPWSCGFSDGLPNPRMQYTATAFAQPFRRVFGLLFQVDERVEQEQAGLRHQLQVTDRVWGLLHEPVGRWVLMTSRRVIRLQSGNIRGYLGWSLGTLLVLLWVIS